MKALNNMAVGTFGAQAFPGDYKFRIQICKDGKVKKVFDKGGSAAASDKGKVKGALMVLKLPKRPRVTRGTLVPKARYPFHISRAHLHAEAASHFAHFDPAGSVVLREACQRLLDFAVARGAGFEKQRLELMEAQRFVGRQQRGLNDVFQFWRFVVDGFCHDAASDLT